jgi:hypothetical protein
MLKNIQTSNLTKAEVVLACAMGLIIVGGVPTQAQTCSRAEGEGVAEVTPLWEVLEDIDIVIEPGALEHEKGERLSRKFKQLAQDWREERGVMSSVTAMSMLPSYQSIIGMGPEALPLILAELRAEGNDPDQWFWALVCISKAADLSSPQIAPEDQGNFRRMAQAWLEWGEAQGYAG